MDQEALKFLKVLINYLTKFYELVKVLRVFAQLNYPIIMRI